MQMSSCNLCGEDNTHLVNRGRDLYLDRTDIYILVRCHNCGLIYQDPQPTKDELVDFYPADNYELYSVDISAETNHSTRLSRQHGMNRRRQRIEKHYGKKGSVLDIGCATGTFLKNMQDNGWQAVGIELNAVASDYARSTLNLEVHTGMLEDITFPDDNFDVVTLWDVFEHVINPKATLNEIRRILKPNGMVVIATPNPKSLEAKLFGPHWCGWDRPRHLHLTTPDVLSLYLHEAGFTNIVFDSFGGRLKVTLLSLEYYSKSKGFSADKWNRLAQALYVMPLRLLTLPYYILSEKLNLSTNATVFARRLT